MAGDRPGHFAHDMTAWTQLAPGKNKFLLHIVDGNITNIWFYFWIFIYSKTYRVNFTLQALIYSMLDNIYSFLSCKQDGFCYNNFAGVIAR